MAQQPTPNSFSQAQRSSVSMRVGRDHSVSPIYVPGLTQDPYAYTPPTPPGSQWTPTRAYPKLYVHHSAVPPIYLQPPLQPSQVLGRLPEHAMAHLQVEQLPPSFEDTDLAQLVPQTFASDISFSLPDRNIIHQPNDHEMYAFESGTYPNRTMPSFGNMEGMQNQLLSMDTSHQPRGFDYSGNMPLHPNFGPARVDTYGMQNQPWTPGHGQYLSVPPRYHAPRASDAGKQNGGMTISGQQHEAAPTTYLPSPPLSAETRLSPGDHSRYSTPLSPALPIVARAKKQENIRVIDFFEKWPARQSGPFTEASLAPFRVFCESELIRLGRKDVSRLFSKQPKAVVGTHVSRTDRIKQRHEYTETIFVCPLVGCGSQCTRKHNLNLHLGAHIGLTDRHCEGCGAYFSASSINRHANTCSGKKTQRPRKRYGARV